MQTKTDRHQQSLMAYYLPNLATLKKLSGFYAVFADPGRVKILTALSIAELCVSDIARFCGMQQSTVSHQLRELRQHNLVSYRRDGKVVYYAVSTPFVAKTLEIGTEYIARK